MAKRRGFSTFSLSFLDIMSCGLGAVALIFLIIKHDLDHGNKTVTSNLAAEVSLLEEEILLGEEHKVKLRNTISELDQQLLETQGLAKRIKRDINQTEGRIKDLNDSMAEDDLENMRKEIAQLEEQKKQLEKDNELLGDDLLYTQGQGDRQYLTGLKLGGRRIAILLDSSASMLDETLVNVIRKRNMSESDKRRSKKWQRAINTTQWLTAQLPQASRYQIFQFNTQVSSAISGSQNQWLDTADGAQVEQALNNIRQSAPGGGTSFAKIFQHISALPEKPDNVFLITDGLPTQGLNKPKRNTVSGQQRLEHYNDSLNYLAANIPVNVILLPMEGDPLAAAALWQLAQVSQGSFMAPAKDWP